MATITPKQMYLGAAATSSATLYTVPSATTSVVTEIIVNNSSASSQTFTLSANSVELFSAVTIAANTTYTLDMKLVLTTGQIFAGYASATSVKFSVNGTEQA